MNNITEFRVYKIELGTQGFRDVDVLLDTFFSIPDALRYVDKLPRSKMEWFKYQIRAHVDDEYKLFDYE